MTAGRSHAELRTASKCLLLVGGCLGTILSMIARFRFDAINLSVIFWLIGIFLSTLFFFFAEKRPYRVPRVGLADLLCIGGILLAIAPVYLCNSELGTGRVYNAEICMVAAARALVETKHLDLLGLTPIWWSYPNFGFWAAGEMAQQMFGYISIESLRFVEGLVALCNVALIYALLRSSFPLRLAFAGSLIFATQHVILLYSRIATWEHQTLLAELLSFVILLASNKKQSYLLAYLGGVVGGFSLLGWPGAAMIPLLWIITMVLRCFLFPNAMASAMKVMRLSVVMALGVIQTGVCTTYLTMVDPVARAYRIHRWLLSPEGAQREMEILGITDPRAAIFENISRGLTVFNSQNQDSWCFLWTPGRISGFVDPATGILLWVGLIVLARRLWQKVNVDCDLLMLTSFLLPWLLLAFIFNRAPVYARLMLTLPSVVYFVVLALDKIAEYITSRLPHLAKVRTQLVVLLSFVIVILNLYMCWQHVSPNIIFGEWWSATVRAIESKKDRSPYAFYLLSQTDKPYWMYADSTEPGTFRDRLVTIAQPQQSVTILSFDTKTGPAPALSGIGAPPFTLLMPKYVWPQVAPALFQRYPHLDVCQLTTDIIGVVRVDVQN